MDTSTRAQPVSLYLNMGTAGESIAVHHLPLAQRMAGQNPQAAAPAVMETAGECIPLHYLPLVQGMAV